MVPVAGLKAATFGHNGCITQGDVVTAVEGKPNYSVTQLAARLDDFKVGDKSKLTVLHQNNWVSLEVVLRATPRKSQTPVIRASGP